VTVAPHSGAANWIAHLRPAHLLRAATLLAEVRASGSPADRVIEAWLRRHRDMGRRDRAIVSDLVYGCLRHARLLSALLDLATPDPLLECAACLAVCHGMDPAQIPARELDAAARERIAAASGRDRSRLPFAVRHSLPDWLADALPEMVGAEELEALGAALNQEAPLDLRVNTLATDRGTAHEELAAAGWTFAPTPWSPDGLRSPGRVPLNSSAAYRQGRVEVQDEGSQLVARLVAPEPGEHVIDLCAGGGGKTLHLGALMQDRGRIDACDIEPRRLGQLRDRARRAALGIAHVHALPMHGAPAIEPADAVLVDAPCSGSGTLRRSPQLKWRPADLDAQVVRQRALLDAAAGLVRPGGRLVYATCSLLALENERVLDDFLDRHPQFEPETAADVLAHQGIAVADATSARGALRVWPHRHGTDGFYAVRLQRRAGVPAR